MKSQSQNQNHLQDRADPQRERRKEHRRKDECEGYAYIQMVGWMDRRERTRRETDCHQR